MEPDLITVLGIRGMGYHGVFPEERAVGQEFSVDVTLAVRTVEASQSDDLSDTVDYGAVSNLVYARIVGEPVNLIETLAERIAADCLGAGPVQWVRVSIHKPSAPITVPFDDVILTITRYSTTTFGDS